MNCFPEFSTQIRVIKRRQVNEKDGMHIIVCPLFLEDQIDSKIS